jgi:hypothetical protein
MAPRIARMITTMRISIREKPLLGGRMIDTPFKSCAGL